ncbi:MAG: SH3 domain-containing protein [Oscillospiraceae bacterium]|jgi:N-acetylmuramoyl-L-alanine amidase|nr:SH3 domain-containing protein [Oscillospiraceae bacterium]
MPIIYLSPSTQEKNMYVTGSGSEEYWMNRLADAMIPYLNSCGIRYTRNTPEMTAGSSIRQANSGWYDFYLALHSNAAAPENYGNVRGIIAFYYPSSTKGQRAAQIFVNNLRAIYPLPDQVVTRSTTSLGEVRDSKFPAVLLELGYHDNVDDATWIETHLPDIARNLVLSLTDFFDIPFIWPTDPWEGTVSVSGTLNLRSRPSTQSAVIANIPNGASVQVYGRYENWYVVRYGDYVGYASADYIS